MIELNNEQLGCSFGNLLLFFLQAWKLCRFFHISLLKEFSIMQLNLMLNIHCLPVLINLKQFCIISTLFIVHCKEIEIIKLKLKWNENILQTDQILFHNVYRVRVCFGDRMTRQFWLKSIFFLWNYEIYFKGWHFKMHLICQNWKGKIKFAFH